MFILNFVFVLTSFLVFSFGISNLFARFYEADTLLILGGFFGMFASLTLIHFFPSFSLDFLFFVWEHSLLSTLLLLGSIFSFLCYSR